MNTTPLMRPDNKTDIQSAIYFAIENIICHTSIYRSCLNCINFKEKEELCGLVNARPPARIIAYSCGKQWEDKDGIPF